MSTSREDRKMARLIASIERMEQRKSTQRKRPGITQSNNSGDSNQSMEVSDSYHTMETSDSNIVRNSSKIYKTTNLDIVVDKENINNRIVANSSMEPIKENTVSTRKKKSKRGRIGHRKGIKKTTENKKAFKFNESNEIIQAPTNRGRKRLNSSKRVMNENPIDTFHIHPKKRWLARYTKEFFKMKRMKPLKPFEDTTSIIKVHNDQDVEQDRIEKKEEVVNKEKDSALLDSSIKNAMAEENKEKITKEMLIDKESKENKDKNIKQEDYNFEKESMDRIENRNDPKINIVKHKNENLELIKVVETSNENMKVNRTKSTSEIDSSIPENNLKDKDPDVDVIPNVPTQPMNEDSSCIKFESQGITQKDRDFDEKYHAFIIQSVLMECVDCVVSDANKYSIKCVEQEVESQERKSTIISTTRHHNSPSNACLTPLTSRREQRRRKRPSLWDVGDPRMDSDIETSYNKNSNTSNKHVLPHSAISIRLNSSGCRNNSIHSHLRTAPSHRRAWHPAPYHPYHGSHSHRPNHHHNHHHPRHHPSRFHGPSHNNSNNNVHGRPRHSNGSHIQSNGRYLPRHSYPPSSSCSSNHARHRISSPISSSNSSTSDYKESSRDLEDVQDSKDRE